MPDENGVVTSSERPTQSLIIETQSAFRCLANAGQSDNEEIIVGKHKVVRRKLSAHIAVPKRRRDNVIDMEWANCREQTVLADISRPQTHRKPHNLVVRVMPATPSQFAQ
ncbi:MAG TPA: hypothetical protein VFZ25_04645 [Chloroflexota bacterium]|nr:hypothetical protein [Chloroflexota bacterium]